MEQKELELNNLKTANDLVEFSKLRGKKHRYYNHYTNIERLIQIVTGGYWYLSMGKGMNDLQEITKGSEEIWNRTYIASYSFGESENIAMWGLYCIPWTSGVRISISGKVMNKWISSISKAYAVDQNNNVLENEIVDVTPELIDVIYIKGKRHEGKKELKWNRKSLDITKITGLCNISDKDEITGVLKNSAWLYENETRIKVYLNQKLNYSRIAVKIPDFVIENMQVLIGPWDNGRSMESIISSNNKKIKNSQITESIFKGLLKMRNQCDSCELKR